MKAIKPIETDLFSSLKEDLAFMALIIQSPPKGNNQMIVRKSGDYAPSYWGDFFISFHSKNSNSMTDDRVNELKEKIQKMLLRHANDPLQEMNLIDAIQRLGLGYHFEEQIDAALKRFQDVSVDDNLYFFALRFRLLRQGGYNVPSDGFKKFKGEDGKFKEGLSGDAKGLLSLYEAAYHAFRGEEILDEAIVFAIEHLKLLVNQVNASLRMAIEVALEKPMRRAMVRIRSRQYISVYEMDEQQNDVLLELAKVDYNRLQQLHQREIRDVSVWWKESGLAQKLSFARDRVVECYFWILGTYHEPQYSRGRIMMTKVAILTTLLDDTYDVYGTLEELGPFTDAIQRWDLGSLNELPDYMKTFMIALFDTFSQFEEVLKAEGNAYRVHYFREAMKVQCKVYYQEFLWGHNKYVPKFHEHLQVSAVSITYPLLYALSFVGMGDIATKEAFDWMIKLPQMIWSSSVIARLTDDLQTDKLEEENDHITSSFKSYMMEHCVSEEETQLKIYEVIEIEWKRMNEEIAQPSRPFPLALYMPALNLACVVIEVFKTCDGFNYPEGRMKDIVKMLVVDPVPV